MKRQYKVGAKVEGMLYEYWKCKDIIDNGLQTLGDLKSYRNRMWVIQNEIVQILFFKRKKI